MEIEFNTDKVSLRLKAVLEKRQMNLDSEVLKDSNFFVPLKEGTLQKSGIINTVLGSGLVQWKTDYARKQYYLGEKLKTIHYRKNPNAQPKWFEAAKVRHLKKWEMIANGN